MTAVTVDSLSKRYRKGQFGYRTLREDLYDLTGRLVRLAARERGGENYIWALKDVSFEVKKGGRLGIIGPNGAGKTTLLRLLAGITKPTEGRILVNGRMGVLIELQAGLHPELTGRENIFLNGAILGMSRAEIRRKFDAIVDFAELGPFIETPVKRYSSGMLVRLGFSVAVHIDPEVLVVDEVLAVGDLAFQSKCHTRMAELQSSGCALVFVSHNMFAVQHVCQQVIWLQDGRIALHGSPGEVCTAYSNHMLSSQVVRAGSEQDRGFVKANRLGSGEVRFSKVETLDDEGNQVEQIRIGEPLRIRAEFETRTRVPAPRFLVYLKDVQKNILIAASDSQLSGLPEVLQSGGVVDCRFESVPLRPGAYGLHLEIKRWGGQAYDVFIDTMPRFVVKGSSPDPERAFVQGQADLVWVKATMKVDLNAE